jgi:hypothetical protein
VVSKCIDTDSGKLIQVILFIVKLERDDASGTRNAAINQIDDYLRRSLERRNASQRRVRCLLDLLVLGIESSRIQVYRNEAQSSANPDEVVIEWLDGVDP